MNTLEDPTHLHRHEVAQRLAIAVSLGGWEGTHLDFKRELGTGPRDIARVLKHLLAFANTPRRTDAYIIFGVNEDRATNRFEHVGVSRAQFPRGEDIENILRAHTSLENVVIDDTFELDGKLTPFIAIPLQFEGPYVLKKEFKHKEQVIRPDVIYVRYGRSSMVAQERDCRKMNDWTSWFLDCRYEATTNSLLLLLKARFPNFRSLSDVGTYVRLVYDMSQTDEFGTSVKPILMHAYAGMNAVSRDAVDRIAEDTGDVVFERVLLSPRTDVAVQSYARNRQIRLEDLEKLYFVDDPYARLCREYLRKWDEEQADRRLPVVIDLQYTLEDGSTRSSILTFLEDMLQATGRHAAVVHGDFGCGKTITAKQFVANVAREYLRRGRGVPRVVYVDVNSMDIRATQEECLRTQLFRYGGLLREDIERIVALAHGNEVHFVFDGVDEMARPYSAQGRRDALGYLRGAGNACTAFFFVRTAYFSDTAEMRDAFSTLAEFDFATKRHRVAVVRVNELTHQQSRGFLTERLGRERTQKVERWLHENKLQEFLADPLVMSLVVDVFEEPDLDELPEEGAVRKRARLLVDVVRFMMKREQEKRSRHLGLPSNFPRFYRVLCKVAFRMVCRGTLYLPLQSLEVLVRESLGTSDLGLEAVEAFRTMSWVHRAAGGEVGFRHQAITLVCAANHIGEALNYRDRLELADWNPAAGLSDIIVGYAAELLEPDAIVGAATLFDASVPFHVRELVCQVLRQVEWRGADPTWQPNYEPGVWASLIRGVTNEPTDALVAFTAVASRLEGGRFVQIAFPLFWTLSRNATLPSLEAASKVLERLRIWQEKGHFEDLLSRIRIERDKLTDQVLLRSLGVSGTEILTAENYYEVFERIRRHVKSPHGEFSKYVQRTLYAFEGQRARRDSLVKQASTKRPQNKRPK